MPPPRGKNKFYAGTATGIIMIRGDEDKLGFQEGHLRIVGVKPKDGDGVDERKLNCAWFKGDTSVISG